MDALDVIIDEKRNAFIQEHNLDSAKVDDKFLSELYDLIETEAGQLKDDGKYDYKLKQQSFWTRNRRIWKNKIVMLHHKLKTKSWYNKIVTPKMRQYIKRKLTPGANVNLCKLMSLSNEEFVKELYRSMFLREPDEDGYNNNLKLLNEGAVKRMDIVNAFYNSPERITPKYFTWTRLAKVLYGDK